MGGGGEGREDCGEVEEGGGVRDGWKRGGE